MEDFFFVKVSLPMDNTYYKKTTTTAWGCMTRTLTSNMHHCNIID